jgi:arginine deiminase
MRWSTPLPGLRRSPWPCAGLVGDHLERLNPEALARVLIAGLAPGELRGGRGVVFEMLDDAGFVIDPLPNLTFCRDSSVWISDRAAVASLSLRRRGESELVSLLYRHHPRFAGTKCLYSPELEQVEGGDVLLLAPSVIAVGAGEQTTPAGVERLARRVFEAGLAHTVLAVPLAGCGGGAHLDTLCSMVDTDTVVMCPRLAFTLTAHTITPQADSLAGGLRVSRPQPFLEAAAQAMGIDRLKVIKTGLEPVAARGTQWDNGGNALAIDRGLVICHERNVETNARLEAAGIRVIQVPAGELSSRRGGPRCMTCPVARESAVLGHAVRQLPAGTSSRMRNVGQGHRSMQLRHRMTPAGGCPAPASRGWCRSARRSPISAKLTRSSRAFARNARSSAVSRAVTGTTPSRLISRA